MAVVVNDMAEVNVDAALVQREGAKLLRADEKLVELSNGCICCTLREDLLTTISSLASERAADGVSSLFDHVLVESSGISEPLPVAETFTFVDDAGTSLSDVAALDTLVTVIDASTLLGELSSAELLEARGWQAAEGDSRSIAGLLCDQIEFANVLILNKVDLLSGARAAELPKLRALLRALNPHARVLETSRGAVRASDVLGTGAFALSAAQAHPGWLAEAREGEHAPETEEFGISSFMFRAHVPFHPARLAAAFDDATARTGPLGTLVRAKGVAWLASRHGRQATLALAGRVFSIEPGPPWWAAIDRETWPEGLAADLAPLWREPHGDRQTEIVVIGVRMERAAVEARLREALLTETEMAGGPEAWAADLADPFAEAWDAAEAAEAAQHAAESESEHGSHSHGHDSVPHAGGNAVRVAGS